MAVATAKSPEPDNWTCPHCHTPQPLMEPRFIKFKHKLKADSSKYGKTALLCEVKVCANEACKEMTMSAELARRQDVEGLGDTFNVNKNDAIRAWNLYPTDPPEPKALKESNGVPETVCADYAMAQKLRDINPAASAMYARRALSGMLEDFCKIRAEKLSGQIYRLRTLVRSGKADWCGGLAEIDEVMRSGKIGKHMETEHDKIVEVDEDEVSRLLVLLERLEEDWFAVRQRRINRKVTEDCCKLKPRSAGWREWLGFA